MQSKAHGQLIRRYCQHWHKRHSHTSSSLSELIGVVIRTINREESSTVLLLQEMFAIREGAERERRVAKVGGWGTGDGSGSEVCGMFVPLDMESESWGLDLGSWRTLDGVSRLVLGGVASGTLD